MNQGSICLKSIPSVSGRGHRDFGFSQPVGSGILKRIGSSVVSLRGRQK